MAVDRSDAGGTNMIDSLIQCRTWETDNRRFGYVRFQFEFLVSRSGADLSGWYLP